MNKNIKRVFTVGIDEEGGLYIGTPKEISDVIGNVTDILLQEDLDNVETIVDKINDAIGVKLDQGTQDFITKLEKGDLQC